MRTKIRRRQTASGVRWYVSSVDAADREEAHGGYATKREATSAAARIRTDAERGRYVSPAVLTVADYLLGEWLPSRENADISVGTRDLDRTVVEKWLVPHIGSIPLRSSRLAIWTRCTEPSANAVVVAAADDAPW